MAAKNNNLPVNMEQDTEQTNNITYANEVVSIIAGLAAAEVEGIAGMCSVSGNILSKNRNVTKGVKVEIGTEEASVDLYVVVEYGTPIQKAAQDAQESVRKAIESMTGLHVVRVDVHVQGVSFEKENKTAIEAGKETAALAAGEEKKAEAVAAPVTEAPKAEETGETPVAEEPKAEEAPAEEKTTEEAPAEETPAEEPQA